MLHRTKVELDHERKLLIYCITNTEFLKQIAPILKSECFKNTYSKTVFDWVIEYWKQFQEAPGKTIQDIYLTKKKYIQNEDDTGLIASFLSSLNEQHVKINVDYTVKQAVEYIKLRSLEVLKEEIQKGIDGNDLLYAEKVVGSYARVERKQIKGINILTDTDAIADAFNEENEFLFKFPGRLGQYLGNVNRGDFIFFLAFSKRGKSFWLMYALEVALGTGLKILFISLEMTERQVLRRLWEAFSGLPRHKKEIVRPYFEELSDSVKKYSIGYLRETREGFPTDKENIKQYQEKTNKYFRSGQAIQLNLPINSVTTKDIRTHIDILENYDEFIPDVIIIDYADLIAPTSKKEYRHQLDEIWKDLRNLSLERNIGILSASQTNRWGASQDVAEDSVAEDIRKIAHATRTIGINQTKKDRKAQVFRLSVLAEREGETFKEEILVLSCLDISRPCLDAALLEDVEYEKEASKDKRKGGEIKEKKDYYNT